MMTKQNDSIHVATLIMICGQPFGALPQANVKSSYIKSVLL